MTVPLPPFWGKSNAAGRPNLLLQHLLDTAAVAELLWDRLLPQTVRDGVDDSSYGRGRDVFRLVAGLHDVGKATPAFQVKVPELAARLVPYGLHTGRLTHDDRSLRHDRAGAHLLRAVVPGWRTGGQAWLWPLVAGHHGSICAVGAVGADAIPPRGQGDGTWEAAQRALVTTVVELLGLELTALPECAPPSRARQLAISGFVIMADWLASDDQHFAGVDDGGRVSLAAARERAAKAWDAVGLRPGWSSLTPSRYPDGFATTFGFAPRPGQRAALESVANMAAPGLLVLEAPMGEGKTEAALAAVEVLAARFGCDGVFVGMPTQATTDAMYARVLSWVAHIDPALPVALLHGKRHFNPHWRALESAVRYRGVDEYGCADDIGEPAAGPESGRLPAEWLLGRKRGLLSPLAIGTIDQLLHAATRTRHVALRHAGLAGKVVVLDEVHAYDIYMSQFLFEALRWLGDSGVPVVLLSATLPPDLRLALVRAYLQGSLATRDVPVELLVTGYPSALTATVVDGKSVVQVQQAELHRPSLPVEVEVPGGDVENDAQATADLLAREMADGGCALVVCNTVRRAQLTYRAVAERFPGEVVLLHGRLTVGERADRAERVLGLLGPTGDRPTRLIVVATQIAEQSFDIDADLVVSDLAPVDLLLQRCGRLHRHDRPPEARPARLRRPRLVVTGLQPRPGAAPALARGSVAVYGAYPLLRSAALVLAPGAGWQVPEQVPVLVQQGYDAKAAMPEEWTDTVVEARQVWEGKQSVRADRARQFLLSGEDQVGRATLAGLHDRSIADLADDNAVAAVVRDGDESVEVMLIRRDATGYRSLAGHSLGVDGSAVVDEQVLEEVLRSAVRLPALPRLTTAAQGLRPLDGWQLDPWLQRSPALVVDADGKAELGGLALRYDPELGLVDEPARPHSTPPQGGDDVHHGTTLGRPRR